MNLLFFNKSLHQEAPKKMTKKVVERNNEYFKKLYASKRRLKNNVLWQERRVANTVASYLNLPTAQVDKIFGLDASLEWLLTWKLKTVCLSPFMWCSGLENLKVKKLGTYQIAFKSDIWVGIEDCNGNSTKGIIQGTIIACHTSKKLKRYNMLIHHEGNTYVVNKT